MSAQPAQTFAAIEQVREFTDCPYRDAVAPGMHSGCAYCAKAEELGVPAALAALQALAEAAERFLPEVAVFDTKEVRVLRDALARVRAGTREEQG